MASLPDISEWTTDKFGLAKFAVSGSSYGEVNAIRRAIISDVRVPAFITSPEDDCQAEITHNTSRMNNEIIKQRLACIPINCSAEDAGRFVVVVDVINNDDKERYVTTADFMVMDSASGAPVSNAIRDSLFPASKLTGEHIILTRLRSTPDPKVPAEALRLTCPVGTGTAGVDGSWVAASTCSYSGAFDEKKALEAWGAMHGATNDEMARHDWMLTHGRKHVVPGVFNFILQSGCGMSNPALLLAGCRVLLDNLAGVTEALNPDDVTTGTVAEENTFDVALGPQTYTLGTPLTDMLGTHLSPGGALKYCGFIRPHPQIDEAVLRLGFVDDGITREGIVAFVQEACAGLSKRYEHIATLAAASDDR